MKSEDDKYIMTKIIIDERKQFIHMCSEFPDFNESISQKFDSESSTTSDYRKNVSELAWAVLMRQMEKKIFKMKNLDELTAFMKFSNED